MNERDIIAESLRTSISGNARVFGVEHHSATPYAENTNRKDVIENRLRSLEAELAEIAKYGDDEYDDGDVLIFSANFRFPGGIDYQYAALKAVGKWFITGGKNAGSYLSWGDLIDFFRRGNVEKIRKVTKTARVV